jgi:hypothetical protein
MSLSIPVWPSAPVVPGSETLGSAAPSALEAVDPVAPVEPVDALDPAAEELLPV